MGAKSRTPHAFTLIELMVLIIILAVLALIVLPRMMGAGRKAKESDLRSHLQELRTAIGKFEADCGDQPARLQDVMQRPVPHSRGGSGVTLDVARWHGPYLESADRQLPKDAFTDKADWSYTAATGRLQSSSPMVSLHGDRYDHW
jgi:general secretion pathway protein G